MQFNKTELDSIKKKYQSKFNEMIDAGEELANCWLEKEGFHPWENVPDVRISPEWASFINSKYYDCYLHITQPMNLSGIPKPGEAYRLFRASIDYDFRSETISFKKDLLIQYLNERFGKKVKGLAFEYNPSVKPTSHQKSFKAKIDEEDDHVDDTVSELADDEHQNTVCSY